MVDFTGGPAGLDLDVRWVHGAESEDRADVAAAGPSIQVHALDEHTYVLRQNKTVHYEGPFLFLLVGAERALLLDTGATCDPAAFPLRRTVDAVLERWLSRHARTFHPLVVAHTHAHGDHVAGDGQFADRPDTTVVGTDLDAVRAFFGFTTWPAQVVPFDLGGGRVLEVTGIPGHHETSIAVVDPWTGLLLTGDTAYPGRLYVEDLPAFRDSFERLVAFAGARRVTHVMGCHIEMTSTAGRDYPVGATYQPDEPPLQLPVDVLREILAASRAAGAGPGPLVRDRFVLVDVAGEGT